MEIFLGDSKSAGIMLILENNNFLGGNFLTEDTIVFIFLNERQPI